MSGELNDNRIHEVWRRVISSSGSPPERYEAILPIILAISADPSSSPQAKDYNVYDDISQSFYGMDSDTDTGTGKEGIGKYVDTTTSTGSGNGTGTYSSTSSGADINIDTDAYIPNILKNSAIKMDSDEVVYELVQSVICNQLQQSVFCKSLSRGAPNRRSLRTLSLISNRDYSSARGLAALLMSKSKNPLNFASTERSNNSISNQPVRYYRSSLRDAWRNEVSLTAQCTSASEGTEDVPLIQALLGAARWHAENAIEIKRLFEQNPDKRSTT